MAIVLWDLERIDIEAATLSDDEADAASLAAVRGDEAISSFSFGSGRFKVEVELDFENRTLRAQVVQPQPASFTAWLGDRTVAPAATSQVSCATSSARAASTSTISSSGS